MCVGDILMRLDRTFRSTVAVCYGHAMFWGPQGQGARYFIVSVLILGYAGVA